MRMSVAPAATRPATAAFTSAVKDWRPTAYSVGWEYDVCLKLVAPVTPSMSKSTSTLIDFCAIGAAIAAMTDAANSKCFMELTPGEFGIRNSEFGMRERIPNNIAVAYPVEPERATIALVPETIESARL